MRQDRRQKITKTSEEIESRLDKGDIIGAFGILRHWYRKFTGKTIKPCCDDLEQKQETYATLFTDDGMTNEIPLDFEYNGEMVKDEVPDKEEIRAALFKMRNWKAPGLTRISVDAVKTWY